jgi:OPT family oligopeptide transporter
MASKTTPFLLQGRADRLDASDYGAMSLTPDRNASPAGSDVLDENAHPLRRVTDTNRSDSSRRSVLSKKSAVLVSGLEGRFGVAEASLHGGMLDDHIKDDQSSEDNPLLDDHDTDSQSDYDADDNSPHEAVRASVPPTDDTTLSVNTPRMWCLSVLFSILGSSTNLFFSLRYPSVAITPIIALLLVHPLGHMWDYIFKRPYDPEEEFVDGVLTPRENDREANGSRRRFASWRQWLAQGRWNEKEHTCVYVSSNVAFGFAFATDVIVEQTQFYNQEAPIVYQLLLTISTQVLGYGFAGLTRRFLVNPSGMIWPGTLMSAAMFSTLHKQDNKPANGWTMSRWRFFYIVWIGAFIFYFLPGLLMPALSYFNVVTWFAPKSVVLANLFGVASGLGLFPLTFDWAQITYVGSPLLVPFWAAMNVVGGLAIIMWIIAPILYYSNFLFSAYMPILSAAVFDNTGNVYDVSRILTSDYVFDRDAYQKYSRVFLPVTYMLSYGMQFAGLAALLTHTLIWHGQDIWRTGKRAFGDARGKSKTSYHRLSDASATRPTRGQNMSGSFPNIDGLMGREDVHSRLMKRYKDAPLSWYLLTFASMAAIGIFIVE